MKLVQKPGNAMHQGIIRNSVSLIRIKNLKVRNKSFEIMQTIGTMYNDDIKTGIQLSSQAIEMCMASSPKAII